MDNILDSPMYRSTRWTTKLVGLWPFQSARKNNFLQFITIVAMSSIALPVVIRLVESINNMDTAIECSVLILTYAACYIKFSACRMQKTIMNDLLLWMEADWKSLKNDHDMRLLRQFTERGSIINNMYTVCFYGFFVLFYTVPIIPLLMNIGRPTNESHARTFILPTEYFIDQHEYYFLISAHAIFTIPAVASCLTFYDNLISMLINHICGMCNVLKSHLENIYVEGTWHTEASMQKKIQLCIGEHTRILQFVACLESFCTIPLFLMTGIVLLVITMTGTMIIMKGGETSQVIRFVSFNTGGIFHLFWSNWQGHNLIVQSEGIHYAIYQSRWYMIHVKFQRLLIPMMVRSASPCKITAAKLYVMSMGSFSATMRTAMSFFTVLRSMQ